MPGSRILIVLGVAVAAVVLFVVLRPGEDEPEAPADEAAPPAAAPGETDPADEPEAPAEPEPEAEPETISIVVRDGVPEGGVQRLRVSRGAEVRIVVRTDVADDVHLHGYDILRPVAPGSPAQIRFTATIPGRFEVELEARHRQIAEIDVLP